MPLTNRSHQALLNSLFGNTSNFGALASAPTVHVALSTTAPTMAGGNVTEPSGNGYARVATTASDWANATDADPSVLSNAEIVSFPEATGAWGTVTHFALYDASSNGNVVGFGALTASRSPDDGDTARFAVGELVVQLRSPT